VAEKEFPPGTGRLTEAANAAGINTIVFMFFVVGGCAYIVVSKLAGIGQIFVTFVPVAIMLAYALLIGLAASLRLRDDQSGDNLYYMGFLFTLTSLGVSLYQFTATRAAEEIVQNFGIAIGSTITGIGLRVIFNQMRRDPVEVERVMRLELAEAARRVRRELDSTVVEFSHFRRSAQQAAADSFSQVVEKFDAIAARFVAGLEDVASKLTLPLETASRQSADALGELTRTMGTALAASAGQLAAETEKLSERTGAISAALEDVVSRLSAMQTPDRVIEVRLEPMAQTLAQAVDRFAAQSDGQTEAVTEVLNSANAATKKSIESITALRQEFGSAASTNRAALEAATKTIKAMAEILDEFKTNSRAHVDILWLLLDKTDLSMRTFTDVLVKSGVEAAAQTDRLREVLPAIEASAQTLARAAERLSGAADELRIRRAAPRRETIG
jgi:hypothetical protein